MKTNRSAAKRFGNHRQRQVQAAPQNLRHILTKKNAKRTRPSGPGHAGRFGQRQGRQEASALTPSLAVLEKYGRIFQGTGGDF
jgi:ribosomal protein L35